jgi:septum formation protein
MLIDKLYLGSKSPRRRQLAANIFNDVEALDVDFDEPSPGEHSVAHEYVTRCVNIKMNHAREELAKLSGKPPRYGLLVADTTVALGETLLGKPEHAQDARKMLKTLSGRKHVVYTAYFLGFFEGDNLVRSTFQVETTGIRFRKLSSKEIAHYVRSGEASDKAGSYGFQGTGLGFVSEVEGSYFNVMGLPMMSLADQAVKLGFARDRRA